MAETNSDRVVPLANNLSKALSLSVGKSATNFEGSEAGSAVSTGGMELLLAAAVAAAYASRLKAALLPLKPISHMISFVTMSDTKWNHI